MLHDLGTRYSSRSVQAAACSVLKRDDELCCVWWRGVWAGDNGGCRLSVAAGGMDEGGMETVRAIGRARQEKIKALTKTSWVLVGSYKPSVAQD